MQQQLTQTDNQLLALIKQFNPLTSAKIVKNSQRQLNATEELIKKLDELVGAYKSIEIQPEGVIKGAVKDRAKEIKNGFSLDSILRKVLNPSNGSLLDKIVDRIEDKRIFKTEKKEEKKLFKENFFNNTALGRTVDPKSEKGKNLFETEYKRFEALQKMKAAKEKEIARKEKAANLFGGMGGPTKKDLAEMQRINNTIEANSIRVSKGKKAEEEFLGGRVSKEENISYGTLEDESYNDISKVLKLIEINTRPDKYGADDIEKDREKILKSKSGGSSQRIEIIKPEDIENATGGKGIFSSIFDGIKGVISKLFSPRLLLRTITKIFAPAMLIASIFNGIKDGITEFAESGSISKALIAGFGGILDFLTFGILDKKSLQNFVDYVNEGIGKLIDGLKDIISGPINAMFESVSNFYKKLVDTVGSFIKKTKNFFGFGDKKDEVIAPKSSTNDTKKEVKKIEKAANQSKSDILKDKPPVKKSGEENQALSMKEKRSEIDKLKMKVESNKNGNNSTVVAPVVNTSASTHVHQKAPVRNTEASVNRYLNG